MTTLVTGTAGFIGFTLSKKLLERGDTVVGLDNLNDYYDVSLKEARLKILQEYDNFTFQKLDLANREGIEKLFADNEFTRVANLAAQAGVRYSIDNPHTYIDSNVTGFLHILEGCRHHNIEHLVYASTSSVYGAHTNQPFSETTSTEHPMALYAATKKANEMMAHSYSSLYNLPTTGLRFFTVYGPWGRPDMALFLFTDAILKGQKVSVFNHGDMVRDFTYVDDIVEGVMRALDKPATNDKQWDSNNPSPATSYCPYRIYNIGNNQPIKVLKYIEAIEKATGKKADLDFLPMQPGDVPSTAADVSLLEQDLGYRPEISVEEGVARFIEWYQGYYSE